MVKKKMSEMDRIVLHAVDVLFNNVGKSSEKGDVLIFLPGRKEIHLCVDLINKRKKLIDILTNSFVRKVVCCTNIAETSLTIPGVRFVIDGGKAYKMTYDHKLRVSALKLQNSSQAAAKQRKGRAGRVQSGWCFRLYSKEHFETKMPEYDIPEIKRLPIDELYLYALDVVGGLEQIHLMADAQPDEEVIQCGKERLFNFGFIEMTAERTCVTEDGNFALQMSGDLSLEGTRMIIEAWKLGVSEEAFVLAVLLNTTLENDIFERYVSDDVKNSVDRKKLLDELGDHLTLLNIYKHFQEKMSGKRVKSKREEDAKSWCENLGISFIVLDQIRKSSDNVYKTLKRNKKYGNIYQRQNHSQNRKRKKKNNSFEMKLLVENRETLLKCVVAGYFHNIVEPHDTKHIKYGYSMITPTNYGSKIISSENSNLLKIKLEKESSLFTLGDTRVNTMNIFNTLFMVREDLVLMKGVTKIRPEWILHHASPRWQRSIGLDFFGDPVHMKSFVKKHSFSFIGQRILSLIRKETVTTTDKSGNEKTKSFLKLIEEETNAIVHLDFDTAKIKFFGSQKEVNVSMENCDHIINRKVSEEIQNDNSSTYPDSESGKSVIATINAGILVANVESNIVNTHINDWNEVQTGTIIILNCHDVKNYIKETMLKLNIQETPKFHARNTENFSKVSFTTQKYAKMVCESMQSFSLFQDRNRKACCFLDKEISINVIDTDIYPSIEKIASNYSCINVSTQFKRFTIRPKKKWTSAVGERINCLLEELTAENIFGICTIEDDDFCRDLGQKDFIYQQVKKKIKEIEDSHVKVFYKKYPVPRITIYGETLQRTAFKNKLQKFIESLKKDIDSDTCYTITFNNKITVKTRLQFSNMLGNLSALREKHRNTTICLYGGNEQKDSNSTVASVVHVLSDNLNDGRKAEMEILTLLEKKNIQPEDEDAVKCTKCMKVVHIPMTSKQKGESRTVLRKAREEKKKRNKNEGIAGDESRKKRIRNENEEDLPKGRRLILCGCIYCIDCFREMLFCQLKEQSALLQHKKAVCYSCEKIILIKDLFPLSKSSKKKLYELAFRNYLLSEGKKKRLVIKECPSCGTFMLRRKDLRGVFKCINNQCPFIWCSKCGSRVMNQIDFEVHRMC